MLADNLCYNESMKELKILNAKREHKDFLIKANMTIHEISEQSGASLFAEMFERDYFCDKPKFCCLVAEIDNIPVGMLLYSTMYWADDGLVLWVSQMYVEKAFRKNGVALKLYEALKSNNPEAKVVACATGKNNIPMNRILKGLGFKVIDMNFYAKKL